MHRAQLTPHQRLLPHTDGLAEARAADDTFFPLDRHALAALNAPALDEALDRLLQLLHGHTGRTTQADDLTCSSSSRTPPPAPPRSAGPAGPAPRRSDALIAHRSPFEKCLGIQTGSRGSVRTEVTYDRSTGKGPTTDAAGPSGGAAPSRRSCTDCRSDSHTRTPGRRCSPCRRSEVQECCSSGQSPCSSSSVEKPTTRLREYPLPFPGKD
ncbi:MULTISPECIES: SpoIIE family protein phosphatase [Streptomyces]|uniref:SpoIIE family protein phosphatase n=1 Tax=Streptomyces TaxID=1883 RepID=UPI001670212C